MTLLEPNKITRKKLSYYVKRAKRLGIYWRALTSLERALLEVSIRVKINEYKNNIIRRLLSKIVAKIEMHTMKGRILVLGLRRALSLKYFELKDNLLNIIAWARRKINYILYLGRNLVTIDAYIAPVRDLS